MLDIQNIFFSYQNTSLFSNLSFSIENGKNLAIIGESGCGKSTLLKIIYGLYDLDAGEIQFNDQKILGPKFNLIPGENNIKYLAQDFDLMPFITAAENVGKYLSNMYQDQKTTRINQLLEMVEMTEFANIKVKYLSGGQMQRIAIARVLALEPKIILLDEPFSHIDNFRRNSLKRKLFAYLKEKQITCIMATHDSSDVLAFADEVLILKEGKIVEIDKPSVIYSNPKNKYVASLFGDVNEIPSQLLGFSESENILRLVFPNQLIVVENSKLKVEIQNSFFKGNGFLIASIFKNNTIYFESSVNFDKGSHVFLKLK